MDDRDEGLHVLDLYSSHGYVNMTTADLTTYYDGQDPNAIASIGNAANAVQASDTSLLESLARVSVNAIPYGSPVPAATIVTDIQNNNTAQLTPAVVAEAAGAVESGIQSTEAAVSTAFSLANIETYLIWGGVILGVGIAGYLYIVTAPERKIAHRLMNPRRSKRKQR